MVTEIRKWLKEMEILYSLDGSCTQTEICILLHVNLLDDTKF